MDVIASSFPMTYQFPNSENSSSLPIQRKDLLPDKRTAIPATTVGPFRTPSTRKSNEIAESEMAK